VGHHDIHELDSGEARRGFLQAVLVDLQALDHMLDAGLIDDGVRRIGAEQEVFLVDETGAAAPIAMRVIERADDRRLATELALFNLELNLTPLLLEGSCLSALEAELTELIARVRAAARPARAEVVLAGILPTLRPSDLTTRNLTPLPRYQQLDNAVAAMRRGPMHIHIRGLDELRMQQESLMLEASECSFQVHLQVPPAEFALAYNAAQAFAAPVLAAATNSPILLGKRLWHETRVALFQQSTDTRTFDADRDSVARVTFGRRFIDRSVVEIYQEDIARFRPIIGSSEREDPFAALARGEAPALTALRLYNGTVWRWNRPCYGIIDGRPHLRIENRLLPSGPSIPDEIANAAFWVGLLRAAIGKRLDPRALMSIESARVNLVAAARLGLDAGLQWFGERSVPADRLIESELLPLAREGLDEAGVAAADSERYLGIVAERVASRRTGSRWVLDSLAGMGTETTRVMPSEKLGALVRGMIQRQKQGEPVHAWTQATLPEAGGRTRHFARVEQYMTTDLFTVREDDPIELVANLMDWRAIRHVPVEDRDNHLIGMVSYRSLLRLIARGNYDAAKGSTPVSTIMSRTPIAVSPETPTIEAIETMVRHGISCLAVVRDGRLVGIVSERDLMGITRDVLLERLRAAASPPRRPRAPRKRVEM
jgi:CBS domain-containing protein